MSLEERLRAAFDVEHREHLAALRETLAGEAPLAGPVLDEMYRRVHSLKGAARAVGLRAVDALAHRLEELFAAARRDSVRVDRHRRTVERVLDAIEDLVPLGLAGRAQGEDPSGMEKELEELLGMAPAAATEVSATAPSRSEEPVAGPSSVDAPVGGPPEEASSDLTPFDEPLDGGVLRSSGARSVRVEGAVLDRLGRSVARLREAEGRRGARREELEDLARSLRDRAARVPAGEEELRRHLGELARRLRRVVVDLTRSDRETAQLALDVEGDVTSARLVPATSMLGDFGPVVRNLAREEGVTVRYRSRGLELPVDRGVLQAVRDPLLHLLRNAVAHGAGGEDGADRRSELTVELELRAAEKGVEITVADDGVGLGEERLRAAAVRSGLALAGEVEAMSGDALRSLAFEAGLSTRSAAGSLAGRGMGLSVVREAVHGLGGEVEIAPASGGGTRVTMRLPRVLARQSFLGVRCRDCRCGLPAAAVGRLAQVAEKDLLSTRDGRLWTVEGETIPVVALAALLGLGEGTVEADAGKIRLVVVDAGRRRVALAVDAFEAVGETTVEPADPRLPPRAEIAGVFRDDEGGVGLALVPDVLVQRAAGGEPLRVAPRRVEEVRPTILVVDDSITTRTLEEGIFAARGYRVLTAEDGQEALEVLEREEVDLVVTDLQMPRLDGFGLLEAMGRRKMLDRTPAVLVTSVDREEERRRGFDLGAAAYLVKRTLERRELLEAVERLL